MLEITVNGGEFWNNQTEEFMQVKPVTLRLEHSLISLTRWEQKYKRPFLDDSTRPQNLEETLYYIKCMSFDQSVSIDTIKNISQEDYQRILDYIHDPMTATTITDRHKNTGKRPEVLTSELIYYYMSALNIPFSCEKWHLNNLLTLIKVANVKSNPEKMSKADTAKYNAAQNKARRAAHHSKG